MITFKHFLLELEGAAPTPSNVDSAFTVGKVKFDNENGMGATPNNGNVLYMGCVAWMPATAFRKLAHEADRSGDAKKLEKLMRDGKSIGCPFLSMQETFDKNDRRTSVKVTGHEGRARSEAFAAIDGSELLPVHLFFRGGTRARDLKDELFEFISKHGIVPEGSDHPIASGIEYVYVAGRKVLL